MNLDNLLESISVMPPGHWENNDGPRDWWAVVNDDGIIAYFGREEDAFRFRLDYINALLNPITRTTNSHDEEEEENDDGED